MSVQGASPEPSLDGNSPPVSVADQPLDFLDLEFWPAETDFRLDQMASTMEWLGQLDAQAGGNPLQGQQPGTQQDLRGNAGGQEAVESLKQQTFEAQLDGASPEMNGVSPSSFCFYAACLQLPPAASPYWLLPRLPRLFGRLEAAYQQH